MSDASDRDLGMYRPITRRDFIGGVIVAVGAACTGQSGERPAVSGARPAKYPPALTGLRGSHAGAYEVAHALRFGQLNATLAAATDSGERYDLVVVGAGISGLSAAHFWRKGTGGSTSSILILDNHDDYGGHARRNEFRVGNRLLIGYAGTQSIESPAQYSSESHALLRDLGVDTERFKVAFDQKLYESLGCGDGLYFDPSVFGTEHLAQVKFRGDGPDMQATLARAPLTARVRRDLVRLYEHPGDYLPGLTSAQKKARLAKLSYKDYLLKLAKVDPGVVPFLQTRTHPLFGVGIDAVSALDCWGCRGIQLPGFKGLALDRTPAPGLGMTPRLELAEDEDYIYHFPDGNASIARLLVRSLIPGSTPGSTMDDIVTAPVDYGKLDVAGAPVRLRLESTVVRVRHRGDPATSSEVEITYVRDGKASIVRAKQCVLACWNMVIPFMCPEMSDVQKGALAYGAKVPLLYTNVAIRDWTAFQKLGVANVTALGSYYHAASLDYPVTIGGYNCPRSPTEPIVVHLERTPCTPGYPARHQQRNGRQQLLDTPFETIERETRTQLGRMLGPGGFDPARDIVAITANRWPHGYTYEYNSLWDPEWTESEKPCVIGRQRFGRIAIANADAGAYAYTNSAIDQAWRAVNELRATGNHTQSASAPG